MIIDKKALNPKLAAIAPESHCYAFNNGMLCMVYNGNPESLRVMEDDIITVDKIIAVGPDGNSWVCGKLKIDGVAIITNEGDSHCTVLEKNDLILIHPRYHPLPRPFSR